MWRPKPGAQGMLAIGEQYQLQESQGSSEGPANLPHMSQVHGDMRDSNQHRGGLASFKSTSERPLSTRDAG